MSKLKKPIDFYKKVMKLGLSAGGPITLAIGATKLVDALDAISDDNIGIAVRDIWAASAGVLKTISDALHAHHQFPHTDSFTLLKQASDLFTKGEFEQAAVSYRWGLLQTPLAAKYRIEEFLT